MSGNVIKKWQSTKLMSMECMCVCVCVRKMRKDKINDQETDYSLSSLSFLSICFIRCSAIHRAATWLRI